MARNTVKEMTSNFGKLDKFEGHDLGDELMKDDTVKEIRRRAKWENDNYICRGPILNEDALSKKFLVSNFNNYKMIDSRHVMEQFNELFRILRQYIQHGLKMDESISVSSLGSYLRIEESLRMQDNDKEKGKEVTGPSVNMTKEGAKNKNNKQNKGKKRSFNKNSDVETKRKKQMLVVRERGLRTNPKNKVDAIAWWINSGAITHVCKDRCWFKTYEPVKDMSVLYMGDDHFAPIHEKGSVVYESDMYILLKSGVFVGFGYYNNGHMHYKRMLKMSKDDLIPTIDENLKKYTTYAIFNENHFSSVPRPKDIIPNSNESQRDDHSNDVPSETPEPRRGCKPLGCKWIFKRKMKVDGTIDKFKARLVIQGFRQKEWIDYFDTYAPASHITTIRLLLALEAIHNLVIHQIDVKTTFLNGDLEEEVYIKQPKGFVMPGNEHKVGKLVKSLYVLKQAPKQWHQNFDEVVSSSGFLLNQSYKCVYSKFDDSDKDMGEVDVILGIKIKHENKGIVITQSHYIEKILKKFNREDCSPVSTLMDQVEKLMPNTSKPVDQLEYARAIGLFDVCYDKH
uniref:Zinc finger, CCHC-type n=1 Tax=Tanacetum cinerariifolium TaxID=118510 RepID=A0A6L2NGS2_TANCI|nr:zinc finger, CCHC-type [Tanacetum cinerariifolium]